MVLRRSRGDATPINQERIQRLKEFGLTDYQARVYLTLLDLGTASASQVPALSRVPRTRIYATVRQLHDKGLVQILPEKPLRYTAIPFSAYLDNLAEEFRGRADRIDANRDRLAQEFRVLASEAVETRGRFEAIYGRRNVRKRIVEMYMRAQREIITVGSARSPGRVFRSFAQELADRSRAGVKVKLAFHLTPENTEGIRALQRYGEVRLIDFFVPICRHGVDDREFLMSHPIPDDDSSTRGEDIAIWTDDAAIAGAMTQMADLLWEMGRPAVLPRSAKTDAPALVTTGE